MRFDSIELIMKEGYEGFQTIGALMKDPSEVPYSKGIYMVLHDRKGPPKFVYPGSGGHFNNKDPNVKTTVLESRWITETVVIYIGQAGGVKGRKPSNETLKDRVSTFLSFGRGNRVAHWGGRYIWQISGSKDLLLCWRESGKEDPAGVESRLLDEFETKYGVLPFANLKR